MRKKCLALLLALVMCVGLLPTAAFAADEGLVIENGVLTKYMAPAAPWSSRTA